MKLALTILVLLYSSLINASYKNLSETGLYKNIRSHEIKTGVHFYSPQYPLWTDGASKKRYLFLPSNTKINTDDQDNWQFPNGTKVWKEFSFPTSNGLKRVETRLIEKNAKGEWEYYTFIWNKDETEAKLAPEKGIINYFPINDKVSHDIPNQIQCSNCHGNQRNPIISFSALQLSPDRDPNALHQDQLTSEMMTLKELYQKNLVTTKLTEWPSIKSSDSKEKSIIGYLHGNCSSCHKADGVAFPLGMNLKYEISVSESDVGFYQTALNRPTKGYTIPGNQGVNYRLKLGSPSQSAILFRTSIRGNYHQMVPYGSKLVDQEFKDLLKSYLTK